MRVRICGLTLVSLLASAQSALLLKSGPSELRIRVERESAVLESLGPAGQAGVKLGMEFGLVDGRALDTSSLKLVKHEASPTAITLTYDHRVIPVRVVERYRAMGQTGVFAHAVSVENTGERALAVEKLLSAAMRLPGGSYTLNYLAGGWGRERQFVAEDLEHPRDFVSARGRSTNGYSPWFAVHNKTTGIRYGAQLAWSGNWQMRFEPAHSYGDPKKRELMTALGVRFDFGGAMQLAPGDSFEAPEAAIAASAGDMDDLANQFHRYQREFVVPKSKTNSPPLVQFNSWYPFPGKMTVADMKKAADAAAEMGAEVFVLDAGWYNKKDWSRELGDYKADRVAFPKGIEELSEHVRAKGMKFGIWVEIENAGPESDIFKTNPEWFFQQDGKPVTEGVRSMMDFSNAHASYRAREVLEKLVKDYELSWVKIDYNIDIGERFDPAGMKRPGDKLINHLRAYYKWLDWARGEFPGLVIENCSSGGLRFDLGLLGHTHTTWLSDEILPKPSLALGWGCALEFLPEACNHWMVGDTHLGDVRDTSDLGWMEFMLRVPMNGQYGLSSKIFDWTPAMRKLAADNIAIYKRIRTVIAGGDTYHLTPQPSMDDPRGWMAMQYAQPDQRHSVVLAYRLPGGEASRQFKLRGLNPSLTYSVKLDGKPLAEAKGSDLASSGLRVALNAEWRAAVVELEAR